MTWKLHFNLGRWFSLLNLYKNLLFTTFKLNLEVLNWLVLLVDLMKFVWLTWGMGLKKMVTNRSFSIAGLKIEFKAGIRSLNSDDLTTPFCVLFFYQPLSFHDVDGFNLKAYKITVSLQSMTWLASAIERKRL